MKLFLTRPSYMHFRHLSNKTWDLAIGLKILKSPFSALLTSIATTAMSACCAPSGPRSHFFNRSMVLTQPRRTVQGTAVTLGRRRGPTLSGANRPSPSQDCWLGNAVTSRPKSVLSFFFRSSTRVPFLSGLVVRPSAVFKIQINDAYLVTENFSSVFQHFIIS